MVCIIKGASPPFTYWRADFGRHLMTGAGAYFYITWGIWLRHCLNGRQAEYDLNWPRLFSLPEVARKQSLNGHATEVIDRKVK